MPLIKPLVWALILLMLPASLLACGGSDEGSLGQSQPAASGGGAPSGDALTVPDTDALTITTFDLPLPGNEVLYAFGSIWVFSFDLDVGPGLYQVDPSTGSVGERIDVPTLTPAMLEGTDALWLAGNALFRVDPGSGTVAEISFQTPPDLGFLPDWGIWQDRIFVVSDDGKVFELNTGSGVFTLLVDSGATDKGSSAFSGQYVWIENVVEQANTLDLKRTLIGINLADGSEVGRTEIDGTALEGAGDAVWAISTVLGSDNQGYFRIEPETGDVSFQELVFPVTPFLISAVADEDAAWLSYQGSDGGDFVLRVSNRSVQRASVSSSFPEIVVGGGAAWLVDSDVPVLERVAP